jgi:hypothetical protein
LFISIEPEYFTLLWAEEIITIILGSNDEKKRKNLGYHILSNKPRKNNEVG